MSEFLNEENNDKISNDDNNVTDTAETLTEDLSSANQAPAAADEDKTDFTIKSGVDYYCSTPENAASEPAAPQYTYSPSAQNQGYVPPQQQPQNAPGGVYSFNGGYIPPNGNYPSYNGGYVPPNTYRPPVAPGGYPPYEQPGFSGNTASGSYNYQTSDNAYRNAIKKTNRKPAKALIAIAIAVAFLCVSGILTVGVLGIMNYNKTGSADTENNSSDNSSKSNVPSVIQPAKTPEGALSIPQIIQKLKPSVVAVEAENVGSGTGIIMTKDGYILTNAHVVEGASKYQIITYDGKQYDAKLQGLDSISDIAVLKVENTEFTPAEFGKSADVIEGETVVAMGNPYGLDLANTTTAGIISAIRDNITLGDVTMDLLQTDASINPGNSGGPLINQYGLVIGITSLKIMSSSGYTSEGLGFAIPIDTAKPIVDEIIQHGYLSGRPMVGITGQYLTQEYASTFNLPAGILVQSTTEGTDAAKKLQKFDMITKINDKAFASMDEFNAEKNKFKTGDTIELTVYRNNKEIKVNLILAENKGK